MDSAISTILIVIAILAIIFLILREVMCWYWKINDRISLQKEQNLILKRILDELRNEPKTKKKTHTKKETNNYTSNSLDNEEADEVIENEDIIYDIEITDEEQKQVDAFIKFGLNPGQRIVINRNSRKIDRLDDVEWNKVDQSEWIILFEK